MVNEGSIPSPSAMKIFTDKDDLKFLGKETDMVSLEKRNKAIIEWTIAKHDATIAAKRKAHKEGIEERADAVANFLKAVDRGYMGNTMRYFGRQELAALRGEQIRDTLKSRYSIIKK